MDELTVGELLARQIEESDAGLVGLVAFHVSDKREIMQNRAWTAVGRFLRANPPELNRPNAAMVLYAMTLVAQENYGDVDDESGRGIWHAMEREIRERWKGIGSLHGPEQKKLGYLYQRSLAYFGFKHPEDYGLNVGNLVHIGVTHPQDPAHIADNGLCLHIAECGDLADVFMTVFILHVFDHFITPALA